MSESTRPAVGQSVTALEPRAVYRFTCDGDNYSPVARKEHSGTVTAYTRHDGGVTYVIAGDIPNAHRALYLLDIAGDVIPCYVAGWQAAPSVSVTLSAGELAQAQATPNAVYVHAMSGINSSGGYAWRMGPRRAYHLILSRTDER